MKIPTLAILTAACLAAASAAYAQIGRSEAPIQIRSDLGEYLQKEGRGVYSGNVEATQGDSKVFADKLTVVCTRASNGECEEIRQLVAEGNVLYAAGPDVKIRGDRAEYDYASDTITVTGDVISSRGNENFVRGNRIVYNVGEGRVKITGGDNRVFSLIKPKGSEPKPAPTTPAPGTPAPSAPAPVRPN